MKSRSKKGYPELTRKNVKRIVLALSVGMGCMFTSAFADPIGDMWYSSVGGTVNGINGMGVYGPTVTMKTPVRTFSLAYFSPPRFTAGCSGISMALGGFNMLSAAEFQTMVRAIIQAAPGYLMELAIKAMCDDCAHIMQAMHALATAVNSGQLNSCRVAEGVINAAVSGTPLAGENDKNLEGPKGTIESQVATAQGYFGGVWSAMNNLFSSGSKGNTGAYQCNSTDYGNTLMDTFYSVAQSTGTPVTTMIDPGVFGGEQQMMQIIQSLVGTSIVHTTAQSPGGGGTSCNAPDTTQTTSNNNQQTFLGITINPATQSTTMDGSLPGILHFNDLVNGSGGVSGNGANYYQCNTFSSGDPYTCQDGNPAPFQFKGIKNYILIQFAGPQGNDPNGNPITNLGDAVSGDFTVTQLFLFHKLKRVFH